MIKLIASENFFTFLLEAITIKQHSKRLVSYEKKVALAAAAFFRKQLAAWRVASQGAQALQEAATASLDTILDIDLGALAKAILSSYVGGMTFAGSDYGLGIKFDLKNPRAVEYIKAHGAELLKELNATTKADIKAILEQGVAEGTAPKVLARQIANLFVEYGTKKKGQKYSRAEIVGITEVGRAYQAGNYGAIQDAMGTGLEFQKSWLQVANACPICVANAAQGWINVDKSYSSGDQYPPAHPICRCAALYRRKA